jgi:hypothetical protein
MSEDIILEVEKNALITLPCDKSGVPYYIPYENGRSWIATVEAEDPNQAGGIVRSFWSRGKGKYYYVVPDNIQVGTAIEVAADTTRKGSKSDKRRWYGFVVRVSELELVVRQSMDAAEALYEGDALASEDSKVDRTRITEAREALGKLTTEELSLLFSEYSNVKSTVSVGSFPDEEE